MWSLPLRIRLGSQRRSLQSCNSHRSRRPDGHRTQDTRRHRCPRTPLRRVLGIDVGRPGTHLSRPRAQRSDHCYRIARLDMAHPRSNPAQHRDRIARIQ